MFKLKESLGIIQRVEWDHLELAYANWYEGMKKFYRKFKVVERTAYYCSRDKMHVLAIFYRHKHKCHKPKK